MSRTPESRAPAALAARLAEIEARLQAATPGPWHDSPEAASAYGTPVHGPFGERRFDEASHVGNVFGAANAAFIAHAPQDIAFLLDALKASPSVAAWIAGLTDAECRKAWRAANAEPDIGKPSPAVAAFRAALQALAPQENTK